MTVKGRLIEVRSAFLVRANLTGKKRDCHVASLSWRKAILLAMTAGREDLGVTLGMDDYFLGITATAENWLTRSSMKSIGTTTEYPEFEMLIPVSM